MVTVANQPDYAELQRMIDTGYLGATTATHVTKALGEIGFLRGVCDGAAMLLRLEAQGIGSPKARKPHEVALATRLFNLAEKLENRESTD